MVKVRFLRADGSETACDIAAGMTVMEGALNGGIEEIVADCGGALSCATCHIYVDEAWMDRVGGPSEMEDDMLEFALDRRATSRLSCQIRLEEGLDGLVVTLPARQQ